MILKPYEVGDLVEYVVDYNPSGELGVIVEIDNYSGRPWVQWLDGSISSPDYDRMRRVEAKNAV